MRRRNANSGNAGIAERAQIMNTATYLIVTVERFFFIFFLRIFRVCNMKNAGREHVLLRLDQVNTTFKSPANIDFLTVIADIDRL